MMADNSFERVCRIDPQTVSVICPTPGEAIASMLKLADKFRLEIVSIYAATHKGGRRGKSANLSSGCFQGVAAGTLGLQYIVENWRTGGRRNRPPRGGLPHVLQYKGLEDF